MQAAFQNSIKSSEISSVNSKNRSESVSSNSQQIQVGINFQGDQNIMPTIILQKKSFGTRNDSRNDFQKCSTASCSVSKKSMQAPKKGEFQNEKEQIHSDKLIMKIKDEQVKPQTFTNKKKKQKDQSQNGDTKQDQIKQSFYGKRFFIGNGNKSVGQQGKQHTVAFLGLFLPIVCFILYEIQFPEGLCSYDGILWILIVSITSVLSLFLFIYCSISNPGFIAIPLTQKQRRALPTDQQKGSKLFDLRYCYTCHIYRPLRTHHCKLCDLCVIERDHHCPFLNNCIGHENRKGYIYFLLVIVTMELIIVTECLFQIIYPFVEDEDFVETIQRLSVILAILQCIYSAIIAANILSLLIFQFQLIAKNHTTDEFRRLIVPDPKLVDVDLNKEFNYGCLSNFNHVLFCSRPPETIYQHFDKLDRTYLIQRYKYYKNKEILLQQEEDEQIQLNEKYLGKSKKTNLNDNHNTQQPLNNNNSKNNLNFNSLQSKPCISPQKQDKNNQDQQNFFAYSAKGSPHKQNQIHLNSLKQLQVQHSQSNKITDKEQSPSSIFKEVNLQDNNQSTNQKHAEQQIPKFDQVYDDSINYAGNDISQLPPPPIIKKQSKNSQDQTHNDLIQINLQDQQNDKSEEDQNNQFNIQSSNYSIRKNKSLFITTKNNNSSSNLNRKGDQNNQNQDSTNRKNSFIQQSNHSIQKNQSQLGQDQEYSQQNHQNFQEYDSNIIIYELKSNNEDTSTQAVQKRSTFSTYNSKSQMLKQSDSNSLNIQVGDSIMPVGQYYQNYNKIAQESIYKKESMNNEANNNNNLNQILIYDDEDSTPTSQPSLKKYEQTGNKSLQNNLSQNSLRKNVGLKNMNTDQFSVQSQNIGENSPKYNPLNQNSKNKILFDKNNNFANKLIKQNSTDQFSISQVYQDNNEQKLYSIHSANTAAFDKNSNPKYKNSTSNDEILRNNKGLFSDLQQEQSTDLPTSLHDQQNIYLYQERIPQKLNSYAGVNDAQNNDDDFNMSESQQQQEKNSSRQKQRLLQKRNKKLFQNMQKISGQQTVNSNNNSFSQSDNFAEQNANKMTHSNSLQLHQQNDENSQIQSVKNYEIQQQQLQRRLKINQINL